MKKKILGFILAICLILPGVFMMSACDDGKTDIAYVQFNTGNSSYKVLYYQDVSAQIYLVPSDSSSSADYLLQISFAKYIAPQTIGEEETLCVNIEKWSSMTIRIKKEYYDAEKRIYVNGEDITASAESYPLTKAPEEISGQPGKYYDAQYFFEEVELIKGNTSEEINTIQYMVSPIS